METVPDLTQPYIPGSWFRKKKVLPIDLVRTWRALAQAHPDPLVRLRLEWVLHLRESGSVSRTAAHFGISCKCLRKWRDRFAVQGVARLVNISRAPHQTRQWSLNWQTKERIASLKREHPVWGREKLQVLYKKRFSESITQWQIQRVITTKGLQWIRPKQRSKPGKIGYRPRIQQLNQTNTKPFELIHADSIELRFTGGAKRYIFTNLEHNGRMGFALAAATKSARHAHRLFMATYTNHPEIVHLHSDNGTDHQGELDQKLPSGVTHWVSRPHTPKDNARLERFHRTLQDECFPSCIAPPTVVEMQERLDIWLQIYNTVRPHQALGNLTPVEYLKGHTPPQSGTHVLI